MTGGFTLAHGMMNQTERYEHIKIVSLIVTMFTDMLNSFKEKG